MARELVHIATISPAHILAVNYAIDGDAPEGYRLLDGNHYGLEWAVARAVVKLLPDELLVHRIGDDDEDTENDWMVFVPQPDYDHGLQTGDINRERALAPYYEVVEWLLDDCEVARRIDLDAITREIIRQAQSAALI